jgi:hypothetical protein
MTEGVRFRKDGSPVHVAITRYPVRIGDRIEGGFAIYRDITEQRRAEERLRRRGEELRVLNSILSLSLEDLPLRRLLHEALDIILSCSWPSIEGKGAVFLAEEDPPSLLMEAQRGLSLELLQSCSRIPFGRCLCGKAAQSGKILFADGLDERHEIRYEGISPHGHYCIPLIHSGRILGVLTLYVKAGHERNPSEERFLQALGDTFAGILLRSREREARLNAERRYRDLLENVPAGIYEIDVETLRFRNVNDYMCRLFGYSREEFLKLTGYDLWTEEGKKILSERQKRVLQGLPVPNEVEYPGRTKDGREIWVRIQSRIGRDYRGKPVARVIMTDVTEHRRLEAQFFQAQKMEAVGRLAGGVAHDINNALTGILGYADLILSSVDEKDPTYEFASEIQKGARRASRTIQQLLAFSRRQIIQPQVLDLNEMIKQFQKMLVRLIGEDIRLEVHLGSMNPMILADRGQMEQVLMNLVVNARDAMPEGGTLTIETADVDLDEQCARTHGMEFEPGPYVMLAVSDTGVGMDEETRSRIFEPFFTTKGRGRGTGLGLSTVYGIVKQSGGYIWAYSEPGRGTTFKVYLPKFVGGEEAAEEEPKEAPPEGGSETVLVVEDDASVRKVAKAFLEHFGYVVLEAANAGEALELCRREVHRIDLLLADVILPEMSGRELAERIKALKPGVEVLYMSGYTDNVIVKHGVLDPGVAFIQKPFTLEALARKVREVLDK